MLYGETILHLRMIYSPTFSFYTTILIIELVIEPVVKHFFDPFFIILCESLKTFFFQ